MKFGLFGGALADGVSNDSQNYKSFVDYVCEADALGFHSVFVVEHHFTGLGQVSATLNLLSYLAAKTDRIRLGTGVTVLPWHNPVLLAEQIATLDLLSGGRVDVGVGKGYRPYEFKGFDIPIEEAPERYEETLNFLVKAWTSRERFSHKGKYWTFNDIVVEPTPVQRPHPSIWVGAGSTPSIEKTAEGGFNLLLDQWATPEVIAGRLRIYEAAALASGRSYDPSQVGLTRAVQVTHSEEERRAAIGARAKVLIDTGGLKSGFAIGAGIVDMEPAEAAWTIAESSAAIGSPEQVIAKLRELEAAGVEYVLLCDACASVESLRDFARDVMPAFAGANAAPVSRLAAVG